MNKLRQIILAESKKARQKRAAVFRQKFELDGATKILDLGSEDGANIRQVLSETEVSAGNVYIADINEHQIKTGHSNFGFQPVLLDESGVLPFEDNYFDIVYCSSVLEHVTVPKEKVWEITSEQDFQHAAWENQQRLAAEIRRVGRAFFVQVPAKSFPVESHTWLPFVGYLPRPLMIKVICLTNRFWVKQTEPDFNLLNAKQMTKLFPDAEIVCEHKFGFVKSIMAIKSLR